MADELVFASYPVFRTVPEGLGDADRDFLAKEVESLLEEFEGRVETRGVYSTTAFKADADLMFWWVSDSVDHIQDLLVAFRRTGLGRSLIHTEAFLGLVRPAEFTADHQPAFVQGKPPKKYVCVYPFVRTPEWYLLDSGDRERMLREHGLLGREFPDVLPNTTSGFGLGDFEWILAFESDGADELVDLIRSLRANESRRYVRVEIPFVTGIRKDVAGVVADLP